LRLRGEDSSGVDTAPVISLEECGELSRELFDGYQRFLTSLDAGKLQDAISYKNTRGELFKTPIGEILVHVALHAAYHRGQVAHVLRANDQTPVNTDFITFTRL
jgi:uncharacterized damage-inducible protein DinB